MKTNTILLVLGLGGAAFAAYWFLFRKKGAGDATGIAPKVQSAAALSTAPSGGDSGPMGSFLGGIGRGISSALTGWAIGSGEGGYPDPEYY
jgi:hypothetical protein